MTAITRPCPAKGREKGKMMILSINANSLAKAKRIAKARNGFYEILYGLNAKRIYKVFYKTLSEE